MAEAKHTEFAMKALGLADLFKFQLGEKPIGAEVPYRAELGTPDGLSTGGGTQAVQPIKLVPVNGGATLVAGSANQADKIAEVRKYDYLLWMHQQRFKGASLQLDRASYELWLAKAQTFFKAQGLNVTVADPPEGAVAQTSAAPSAASAPEDALPTVKSGKGMWIGIVLALVVIGAIAAVLMRK